MEYPTYTDMLSKIQSDLDLEDEIFIQPDEMKAYFNDAIREAEAEICGIYEDYFLSDADLPLVTGESDITLPSDIYVTKIRGLVYHNGSIIFPVKRIRDRSKFLDVQFSNFYDNSNPTYRYLVINRSATDGVQIRIVPTSKETSEANLTLWYIREANKIVNDSDVCDIPEFISFIYAFVKVACRKKEFNGFCPQEDRDTLEQQRKLMIDSLTAMVPDADTEIELDLDFYRDQYDRNY